MHTHKEKDLLRKYLGEHWRKLEDDFFRPVKTTDLLTLEYLRSIKFLEEVAPPAGGATTCDAKPPNGVLVEKPKGGAASKKDAVLPTKGKRARRDSSVVTTSSDEEGREEEGKDELLEEIESLTEEENELKKFVEEEAQRLMRYTVLELSVAEWRRREQKSDHAVWSLYEQLYCKPVEEDDR